VQQYNKIIDIERSKATWEKSRVNQEMKEQLELEK
jgi:hypothetical protein